MRQLIGKVELADNLGRLSRREDALFGDALELLGQLCGLLSHYPVMLIPIAEVDEDEGT